jgi:hypothetical protein
MSNICTVPPAGWSCTREAHHDGPCAAVPSGEQGVEQRFVEILQQLGASPEVIAIAENVRDEQLAKTRGYAYTERKLKYAQNAGVESVWHVPSKCDGCLIQISGFFDESADSSFGDVYISVLSSHADEDQGFWARVKRAWGTLRGKVYGASTFYFHPEELDALQHALREVRQRMTDFDAAMAAKGHTKH